MEEENYFKTEKIKNKSTYLDAIMFLKKFIRDSYIYKQLKIYKINFKFQIKSSLTKCKICGYN